MNLRREFRVVESSVVTDDELTRIINHEAQSGWCFNGFHFAMREGSHRPSMAFVLFYRELNDQAEPSP
ncbi:DUF4177 domain-containing protein [bacterium]|nr:MAG: DUF4177 domain-containing protein [bacterium]